MALLKRQEQALETWMQQVTHHFMRRLLCSSPVHGMPLLRKVCQQANVNLYSTCDLIDILKFPVHRPLPSPSAANNQHCAANA